MSFLSYFFPALKDKRYRINKLSVSEFTISISSVTFKDGGNYTCSQYGHHTIEKKIEVTVMGEYNILVIDYTIVGATKYRKMI